MSKNNGVNDARSKSILLVDDEKDITEVLKRALEREGFKVDAYNDPAEVISKFKPSIYELLIADIRMPRINGFQLFHELTKKDPNLRTCFLSAFEIYENEHKRVFPYSNIVCFIKKPIAPRALIEMIRKVPCVQ